MKIRDMGSERERERERMRMRDMGHSERER